MPLRPFDLYALEQGICSESEEDEQKGDRGQSIRDSGYSREKKLRMFVCQDKSIGLVCSTARVGDLLCDFTSGRKLIVRVRSQSHRLRMGGLYQQLQLCVRVGLNQRDELYLIGTTVLPEACPTVDVLAELRETFERRRNPHISTDVNDNTQTTDDMPSDYRQSYQFISVISSLEAGRGIPFRFRFRGNDWPNESFPQQILKLPCKRWDLSDLGMGMGIVSWDH
jgi:hypothetical protein